MTRTKLACAGFVTASNCMRQQVLDDAQFLPACRSQPATTCDSSYAPNKAQYFSVLQQWFFVVQSSTGVELNSMEQWFVVRSSTL